MERAGVENGAGRELVGQARRARVVIVTYYWPPSGGAGVQRWLKMAKCLAAGGAIPRCVMGRYSRMCPRGYRW